MSEWKEYKIGEIGKVITGKTPRTAITDNYGGKIPFLSPSDDMTSKFVPKTARYLTDKGLSEVKNCLIPKGAICVSCIGSDMGKSVITNGPTVTNQQINSIILNDSFDSNFIYYVMQGKRKEIRFIGGNGTAVPILNKSAFSDLTILAPDLAAQQRIASILSSLDDKIAVNKKICENLEAQAQALFKSWFVDFEPFRDQPFVESELGMIPEGWKAGSLEDITTQKSERVGGREDMKVLSPVTTGQLMLSEEYFNKQVFSESIAKYKVVEKGDFAYNPARVNIGSLGRNNYDFDGCVSPVYVVFSCKGGYAHLFDLYRKTEKFKTEVNLRAIGGVRQSLNYKDFAFIQCIIPPLFVVEEFNAIYDHLLVMHRHTGEECDRLAELRDTLLPRLMSGEIKL